MKLKKFKCPDTGILFEYNETAEIYVSEDAENLMTVDQVDRMLREGKIKFNESDILTEKKAKKESDDEEGTDDDEAVDESDDEDDDKVDETFGKDDDDVDEATINKVKKDTNKEVDGDGNTVKEGDDEDDIDESDDEDDVDENIDNFGDKKAKSFKKESDDDEEVDESDDEDKVEESLKLDFNTTISEADKSALFEGQELSEAFQTKTVTIFEAAVSAKVKELSEVAVKFHKKAADKKVAKLEESLQNQVNDYLDYVVTEWMTENEIAIDNGLKNEMNEEFLDGLKGLFTEHYIEVPEGRYDILEGLADKVESLEEKLDVQLTANSTLMAENKVQSKDKLIVKLSEGLSDNQTVKFTTLLEHVAADDLEVFETKALALKESYFKVAVPAKKDDKLNEDVNVITTDWDKLIAKASNI